MLYNGLTKEEFEKNKLRAFQKLKEPIEDFFNTFCNPHTLIVAEQGVIHLYQGERNLRLDIPD